MKYLACCLLGLLSLLGAGLVHAQLPAPELRVLIENAEVTAIWERISGASGYRLYYAPADYSSLEQMRFIDLGKQTRYSARLSPGAAYFVALQGLAQGEEGQLSNILYFAVDDAAAGPIPQNRSYDPQQGLNRSGNVINPYWRYRVNGGDAFEVPLAGQDLSVRAGDLTVIVDQARQQRRVSCQLQFRGYLEGDAALRVEESLLVSEGRTLILDQVVQSSSQLELFGADLDLELTLRMLYRPYVEWFLDREDLDALPVGYRYSDQGEVSVQLSGNLKVGGEDIELPVQDESAGEAWEIMAKLDSMTVAGRTYQDVVQVRRRTLIPNTDVGDAVSYDLSGSMEDIDYWVARGVGVIKGEGQYRFQGQSLTIELLDTNLD